MCNHTYSGNEERLGVYPDPIFTRVAESPVDVRGGDVPALLVGELLKEGKVSSVVVGLPGARAFSIEVAVTMISTSFVAVPFIFTASAIASCVASDNSLTVTLWIAVTSD